MDALDRQLESVAGLATVEGNGARAAWLIGAVGRWRRAAGVAGGGRLGPLSERRLAEARAALDKVAWAAAWAAGEALSPEAAVADALAYLTAPADGEQVASRA